MTRRDTLLALVVSVLWGINFIFIDNSFKREMGAHETGSRMLAHSHQPVD